MNLLEGVRAAFDMLRAQRLRTFFIVQCTAVGVTFLVAMATIIEGVGRYLETDFIGKVYGFNTVQLRRAPFRGLPPSAEERRSWTRRPSLSFDDAAWLEQRIGTAGSLSFSYTGNARVGNVGGKVFDRVQLLGASGSHFGVQQLVVREGRPFTDREAERGAAVAVLGADAARRLFGARDPVGRRITVQNIPYRVVGVLERRGSFFGFSMDRLVVVPARSPVNGVVNRYNEAEVIAYRVTDPKALATAMAEIEGLMRIRHRLRPGAADDFSVSTSEALLAVWARISRVLLIAGPCLIGISLVVGALVTMNIMLVVVTERVPEIGLRKSVGARNRDILLQFVVEAGSLSGLGGALGVALGITLAGAVALFSPLPARVAPWSAVSGILVGVAVGVIAGVYPAYRAARLNPIVALGRE